MYKIISYDSLRIRWVRLCADERYIGGGGQNLRIRGLKLTASQTSQAVHVTRLTELNHYQSDMV